jgi:hypothetical protein
VKNEFKWNIDKLKRINIDLASEAAKNPDINYMEILDIMTLYSKMIKNREDYEYIAAIKRLRTKGLFDKEPKNINIETDKINNYKTNIDLCFQKSTYKNYFEYLLNISKQIIKISNYYEKPNYKKIKLTNDELYEDTLNFYKKVDKEFGEIFEKTYSNKNLIDIRQINERQNGYQGMCYFDNYYKIPYFYVTRDNTIYDIYNFRHESNHGIANIINNDISDNNSFYRSFLNEVNTYFIELISNDELEKQKYSKKDITLFQNEKINNVHNNFSFLYIGLILNQIEYKNIMSELKDNIYFTLNTKTILDIDKFIINLLSDNIYKYITYSISFLIALDLYKQYQQDQEKAIYNVKKVMAYKKEDFKPFLNSININLDDYYELKSYKQYTEEINQKVLKLKASKKTNS